MSRTLYYVADPMCSWCWGFHPVLVQVKEVVPDDLPMVYVMGGLARDSDEPMPNDVKAYVQNAWREVSARTGASFNWDFWDKCQPRRSTYPSCRAFYAAKVQGAGTEMFEAIQRAYYQEAQNPSDAETLIGLADRLGLDANQFEANLKSEAIEQEMQDGFNVRRSMNANQFPGLVVRDGEQVRFVTKGYDDAGPVLERLQGALG